MRVKKPEFVSESRPRVLVRNQSIIGGSWTVGPWHWCGGGRDRLWQWPRGNQRPTLLREDYCWNSDSACNDQQGLPVLPWAIAFSFRHSFQLAFCFSDARVPSFPKQIHRLAAHRRASGRKRSPGTRLCHTRRKKSKPRSSIFAVEQSEQHTAPQDFTPRQRPFEGWMPVNLHQSGKP